MPRILYRVLQSRHAKARSLRQYLWNCRALGARRRNTYLVEQLENRFLLSADAAPLALGEDLLNEALVVEQLVDAGLAEASNSQELELIRQYEYEEDAASSDDDDAVAESAAVEVDNSEAALTSVFADDTAAQLSEGVQSFEDVSEVAEIIEEDLAEHELTGEESNVEETTAELAAELSAEEPTTAELVAELSAEEPTAAELAAEESTAAELAAEEPIAAEVAAEEPTAAELAADEPTTAELAAEESTAAASVAEEPITTELATEEPTTAELSAEGVEFDAQPMPIESVLPSEASSVVSASDQTAEQEALPITRLQQLSGHQVIVIDSAFEDYEPLLATFMGDAGLELNWRTQSTEYGDVLVADLVDGETSVTVIRLDGQGDGVDQLSELLSEYQDISALHVLSNGEPGVLRLGAATLTSASLEQYRQQLEGWGRAMKAGGDILLYSCNVNAGLVSIASADRLAGVTLSDTASNDLFIDGGWILETGSFPHGIWEYGPGILFAIESQSGSSHKHMLGRSEQISAGEGAAGMAKCQQHGQGRQSAGIRSVPGFFPEPDGRVSMC